MSNLNNSIAVDFTHNGKNFKLYYQDLREHRGYISYCIFLEGSKKPCILGVADDADDAINSFKSMKEEVITNETVGE